MFLRKKTQVDPNEEIVRVTSELWREGDAKGIREEELVAVVFEAIDDSISPLVERLLSDMPRMVRNRRRVTRGFERRLKKRWGSALDLYRACLEVALESGSDFNDKHRSGAAEENDYLFEATTRLHARACTTALEVLTLLQSGFAEHGANARWRTVHELAVVSNVLVEAESSDDLAERYLLHSDAETARDAPIFQEHAPALGYEPLSDEEMQNARETLERLIQRFGQTYADRNGWAATLFADRAPTFAQLEERANMAHMRPWYRYTSHHVHAGSKGTATVITNRGPHRFLNAGATNRGLADPGHGSLIALMQVTVCLLLRTRVEQLGDEPMRLVSAKALMNLTQRAGDAFLVAHDRLENDERRLWAESRDESPD